uniref:Uncharacterized protein n=1 Tax=Euplotes crassus TaxID=5936 RepID=A0A7S3K8K7_EUPCR|mmetsp:Transcript_15105/g.14978  ORF Transcript_15105/g.14978 Transcript_15105/m.14978 type:complete len:420 (+) Transcript_15105:127-1386(+)
MQIYAGDTIFMQELHNNRLNGDMNVMPPSSIPLMTVDPNLANIDCIQSQFEVYPGLFQPQISPTKTIQTPFYEFSERKLPRIERVFGAVYESANIVPASPSRSTIPESTCSFEQQGPANSKVFQDRLHQLYTNLNSMENSDVYRNTLQATSNQEIVDFPTGVFNPRSETKKTDAFGLYIPLEGQNMLKKTSEVTIQYEKLELRNLKRHYKKTLVPVSIKKKCQRRGRKRINVLPAQNFEELLNDLVLPKWIAILTKKTKREGEPIGQITEEYLWIKVLRDMRDFYRMIFKSRFHRSEKREDSNRDLLVKIFLEEMGITDISFMNSVSTFDFLYKAHYKARSTNEGKIFKDVINSTPMRIYYYYSESAKKTFLQDDLCSRLLYYFLTNFGSTYLSCVQSSLSPGITAIINYVVKKYSSGS